MSMKHNIIRLLMMAVFVSAFAGCTVDETDIQGSFPYLESEITQVRLPKDASTEVIEFSTNRNLTVKFNQSADWIDAAVSGNMVTLTYKQNDLEEERSVTLSITTVNSTARKEILIVQDPSGELTYYGDRILRSKNEIAQNTYTKVVPGNEQKGNLGQAGYLVIGDATQTRKYTASAKSVNRTVTVPVGDYSFDVLPSDIDDSDFELLAEAIHLVQSKTLVVANTNATAIPLDLISNNSIDNLHFAYNDLKNLPSASELKSLNLKVLSLEGNALTDISPLESCTLVERLNLSHNNIYDIEPLKSMSSLKSVDLTGLPLTKPQLEVFKEGFTAEVKATSINESASPLPIISDVEIEELGDDKVRLTAKVTRNAENVTSVGFYIGKKRLLGEMTYYSATLASDGSFTMDFSVTTLVDNVHHVRAVAYNESGAGYSNATNFGTLASDGDMKLINMDDIDQFFEDSYSHIYGSLFVGKISNWGPDGIYFKSDKEDFYFKKFELDDLTKLSGLVHVSEGLYIGNTDVATIAPIAHVTGMHTLYLKGNKIQNIPELAAAQTLKKLDVSRNFLKSFDFLELLPQLEELYLGDSAEPTLETNEIGVLAGLEKYTNLKKIDLSGLPLHKFQVDDLKAKMPGTEIAFSSGARSPYLPTLSTGTFTKNEQRAILSGYVVDCGKSAVIEHGFYFGKDLNSLEKIKVGNEIGVNTTFTYEVDIYDEDVYYFYPYAVSNLGESRSVPVSFTLAYDDLSEFGTANCYIVTEEGRYRFNASVKGFSAETLRPEYVEVLWETRHTYVPYDRGAIISEISLVDGYVEFTATGNEGNALIAVKDATGEIAWSWHIWVTDQPQQHHWTNQYGTFILMDRNLGATRADRGTGDEWREGSGTLYQFGRKDPFIYDGVYNRHSQFQTPEESVKYPTSFTDCGTWWNAETLDLLWDPEKKTMWDPCPPGYMVPPKNAYDHISHYGWEWDYGRHFIYNNYSGGNAQAWFPAAPQIDSWGYSSWRDGEGQVRTSGYYNWTHNQPTLYYNADGGWHNEPDAAEGIPVRCMRLADKFIVQTLSAASTETSVTVKGILVLNMEVDITEKGFVYSTSGDPKNSADGSIVLSDTAKGNFSATITGLSPNTSYKIRAYAIGDGETKYGEIVNVNTSTPGSGEGFTGDDFEW